MRLENLILAGCIVLASLVILNLFYIIAKLPYSNLLGPILWWTLWIILILSILGVGVVLIFLDSKSKKAKQNNTKSET